EPAGEVRVEGTGSGCGEGLEKTARPLLQSAAAVVRIDGAEGEREAVIDRAGKVDEVRREGYLVRRRSRSRVRRSQRRFMGTDSAAQDVGVLDRQEIVSAPDRSVQHDLQGVGRGRKMLACEVVVR